MNLHPIFVHFPIAFLTTYAVLELVRIRKIQEKPYWHSIKAALVIIGFLGAIAAAIAGGLTSNWSLDGPRIFQLHRLFAFITIIVSGISVYGYARNKFSSWVQIALATLVLISTTITGGLGGAMVRGVNFDPFMVPIFRLFGVY